jgi:hypothetical protein
MPIEIAIEDVSNLQLPPPPETKVRPPAVYITAMTVSEKEGKLSSFEYLKVQQASPPFPTGPSTRLGDGG